ncbi:MAG: class I SAM-dependent methyltransferase [Acidimicrobiia bacterium]
MSRTRALWDKQNHAVGERRTLFESVAGTVDANTVLYPGSYVDLTPAFIWSETTFVDVDRRANQFFADTGGVDELLSEHGADGHTVRFIHGDYQDPLDLAEGSFDLLISLYAGFISEHCTRYLRVGGHLLVNSSHGDAAMASIDDRYGLRAVITSRDGGYRANSSDLDSYLVPKKDVEVTKDLLHSTGRGISYTKSPFAYLFERYR